MLWCVRPTEIRNIPRQFIRDHVVKHRLGFFIREQHPGALTFRRVRKIKIRIEKLSAADGDIRR